MKTNELTGAALDWAVAKWWASISARLNDACMANLPKPVPAAIEDHTPKAKATTA